MVRFKIMLYNSLDSEECYNSINNSSNKTSISMLVTNYNKYHDLKSKDSEKFILNSRVMKEMKLRKRKSSITGNKKFLVLSKRYLNLWLKRV